MGMFAAGSTFIGKILEISNAYGRFYACILSFCEWYYLSNYVASFHLSILSICRALLIQKNGRQMDYDQDNFRRAYSYVNNGRQYIYVL